jgi:hypothetical protein
MALTNVTRRFIPPSGRPRHTATPVEAIRTESDAVILQRVDDAAGLGRPTSFGTTYAEHEYDRLATEQGHSWNAEGEATARPHSVAAAGRADAADAAAFLLAEHRIEVTAAREAYQHAARTLTPYIRRSPGDGIRYGLGLALLGLGDTAGVWGAAIWLGETPLGALGQAVATGFAAVTAGLAGSELMELREARRRQRDADALTEDEKRYRRLFTGADAGLALTKISIWVSLTVAVVIAISVCALRAGTEGTLAALTFGGLALATALGSLVSSYYHGDEVADLLATYRKRLRHAERHHRRLGRDRALAKHSAATETAASIGREYGERGQAAAERVASEKYRLLRRNPQVVGHGDAVLERSGIIGRRTRDGAA